MLQQSPQEDKTQQITMKLRESKQYWNIKNQVIQSLMQQHNQNQAFGLGEVHRVSLQMGMEEQLKQIINNYLQKEVKKDPIKNDPHDFLNQSRMRWTELLYKNYIIVYEKSKREDEDETSKDQSLYLYDDKNLLNFMQSIKFLSISQSNAIQGIQLTSNKLIQIGIKQKSATEIKQQFECLNKSSNLGSLADESNSSSDKILEKQRQARKLIENDVLESEIERFLQEGSPSGDRSELYQKYFELEGKEMTHQQLFKKSEKDIEQNPSFLDEIMEIDCIEVLEDARYFVFKENIHKVIKALIRDRNLKEQLSILPHQLELPFSNDYGLQLPQCGFFPSKNITKYIAPFCYLSIKVDQFFKSYQNHMIYALFSQFFCKYFCFLHSLSSHPSSILSISMLFEELMSHTSNKLMQHLREIGCDALRVMQPMMQFIFIGYLDTEQVFYILDRVVGFQGNEILAIVATGIMISKKTLLMATKCQLDVDTILKDLDEENALELIQLTLNLI